MSLLLEVTRYCRRKGMPYTRFGRLAVNDPRLVDDMLRGREVGPALRAKVKAFMTETRA